MHTPMFILLCSAIGFVACTRRPIIGILAQDFPSEIEVDIFYPAKTYIKASYVKAVESAGARVVPILINQPKNYYRKLLNSINGVIIPGGKADLKRGNGYYDASTIIYNIAKEINDRNIKFPIYGVCMGFEAILTISNNHEDIRTVCNVTNENIPLRFRERFRRSLMFPRLPFNVYIYLKYFDSTKNDHRWCINPDDFSESSSAEDWLVTSHSVTVRGVEFISTIEHKKYPFMGTQFHPEMYFDWRPLQNNLYSRIAIMASRYFYDRFVDVAKLNFNKFANPKNERASLIYNYPAVYTGNEESSDFEQMYVF